MSFQAKDWRTGKNIERKRPAATLTPSSSLVTTLDDFAKRTGESRSEVAERCIIYGLDRYSKELGAREKVNDEGKGEEKLEDGTVEQKYMRKILFDMSGEGWTQV